jgi:hypothetical protein
MENELLTLAQSAYEAYDKDRGGVNHLGKPNPKWGDLPDGIRHAWQQSVRATLISVRIEGSRCVNMESLLFWLSSTIDS